MNRAEILVLAALVGGCATSHSSSSPESSLGSSPSPAELVAAREAGMHMAATLLYQGIVPRAKGVGDLKDVHYSEGIELWAAAIPGLFPAGSDHPRSRALPTIWTNKPDFDRQAAAMGEAARDVTAAGKAGDLKAYAAAADRLRQSCGACHGPYRADQN